MNRNIITAEDAQALATKPAAVVRSMLLVAGPALPVALDTTPPDNGPKPDNYFDRLLKYIPAELVSSYIVLASPVPDTFDGDARKWAYLVLLLVGLVFTPLFAWQVLKIVRPAHLAITTFAFVVFVASKGDFFGYFDWWKGYYALAAAVVFLLVAAIAHLSPLPDE